MLKHAPPRRIGAMRDVPKKPLKRVKKQGSQDTLKVLSERYIKQKTLGQGAFGLVYSAFDQETGKIVAIKCVKDKESIESFQSELDLLKRLHHQAIVPYLDSFVDSKGALQIVMEYAENGSLMDVIHKYGDLNETVAAIYIAQVLKGLVYLHEQNVIHRDIKAANVLIQGGVAKLADFGLALDLTDYGKTLRECAGSPYWMAPEVISGDPVNNKSDIWSVGATTIELLKGRPPLFDLAPVPAMFQIAGRRPMPIPHDVSDVCYDFLSKCFNKNPKLRPEASELLEHPFIKNSLQIVDNANDAVDVENLTIKAERASLGNTGSSLIASEKLVATQSPEEIVLTLSDDRLYLGALRKTMIMLKNKKADAQCIMNFCGVRTIVEKLGNPAFVTPTLNFIQMLCSQSDRIATSLIEHCIIEELFNLDNMHAKITSLYIIMSSSVGARLFFGTGLAMRILPKLFESPVLKIFSASLLLFLLNNDIPKDLITARIGTADMMKFIIETMFKSVARYNDYMKLLQSQFQKLSVYFEPIKSSSPLFDLLQQSVRSSDENQGVNTSSSQSKRKTRKSSGISDDRLIKPMLSDSLFDTAGRFIDDSILVILRLVSINPSIQLTAAKQMSPLIYILSHLSDFPILTLKHLSGLIRIIEVMCSNCIAKDRLKIDQLIAPIVTFSYSEDPEVLSSSIRCLTRMIKGNPNLAEIAVDNGLCFSLSHAISKRCDVPEFISELLCYIPTVSKFAAFKMKESGAFYLLVDLLNVREWKAKAIHAIAVWACHDEQYIDSELCSENTFDQILTCLTQEIEYVVRSNIQSHVFSDMKTIVSHCQKFTEQIIDDTFITMIVRSFVRARESQQSVLLEFIIEVILQYNEPHVLASLILPHIAMYSESENKLVQRAVLRIRVIARC